MSDQGEQELVQAAIEARTSAHAPYSNYHVGAAIRTSSGRVFTGCNVENASYGLTNCAERTAIFAAVAAGEKKVTAVAVAAGSPVPFPCGACRQVMSEFCGPDTPVYIVSADQPEAVQTTTVGDLLPHAFKLK